MARKSRRNIEQNVEIEALAPESNTHLLATAAYGRLSVENGGGEDDMALQVQATLIHQYIAEQPDLELYDTYLDNGYSGTNFARPGFQRLMDDVRTGKVQCIVVKDLSRFGRDYLETGYYIETLLPKLNVRFIAITDNFDSARESDRNSLSVPIKNMVNALYAKDISKKICAAATAKQQRADSVPNGTAPYGYRFSEDKSRYVVDENVAPYVRLAYYWTLQGIAPTQIAKRLQLIDAVTPGQYRKMEGELRTDIEPGMWEYNSIYRILKQPVYQGHTILGRLKQAFYKGQKRRWTDEDEWIVKENTHEPLVTQSDYEEVKNIIDQRNLKKRKSGTASQGPTLVDCFMSKVYCMECGRKMYYNRIHHNCTTKEKEVGAYFCHNHCGEYIYEEYIKMAVTEQIERVIEVAKRQKAATSVNSSSPLGKKRDANRKEKRALTKELLEVQERVTALYENYATGIVDLVDYQQLRQHYADVESELRKKLSLVEADEKKIAKTAEDLRKTLSIMEQYAGNGGFNQKLVDEFVESVWIGTRAEVEVRLNCEDVFAAAVQLTGG